MAKKLTKEEQEKQQRAVFDRPVQAQRGDIYKVLSKGTCVEFTDKLRDAEAAYKEAKLPREMYKIMRGSGAVIKMREQVL